VKCEQLTKSLEIKIHRFFGNYTPGDAIKQGQEFFETKAFTTKSTSFRSPSKVVWATGYSLLLGCPPPSCSLPLWRVSAL